MFINRILNKRIIPFIVITLSLLPIILPLFHRGMFVSDDGGWMVIRLSDFHQSLKDGQFPVRWAGRLNNSYGYPVFNFLYPGVYYSGEIFHLLGFNFTNSIKILFGLSLIFSFVFAYLWLKLRFSRISSGLGALVYVLFPYHLYDIYIRGSLGEALALMILPLIFYCLDKKKILLGSLSFAYLITVHNTLAFLFSPVLIIYILLQKKPNRLWVFIFGLAVSCFFWLPALYDRQYTIFDSVSVSNYREYFINFQNFSLIGWGSLVIFLIAAVILLINKNRKAFFFSGIFIISLFFALPASEIFWSPSILGKLVQFPWRFLSLAVISLSFLTAYGVEKLFIIVEACGRRSRQKAGFYFICLLIVVIVYFQAFPVLQSIKFEFHPDFYYSTNEATTNVKNEYLPKWAKNFPENRPANYVEITRGLGKVDIIKRSSNHVEFKLNMKTEGEVRVNTLYFPGWYGSEDIIIEKNTGLITFHVDPISKAIMLYWADTPIRFLSNLISVFGLTMILFIYILRKSVGFYRRWFQCKSAPVP